MMRFDVRQGPAFIHELGARVIDAMERENHRWGENGWKRGATVRRKCIVARARKAKRCATANTGA